MSTSSSPNDLLPDHPSGPPQLSGLPTTSAQANEAATTTQQVPRVVPWSAPIRKQFNGVPYNTKDKSMWHGPWDAVLHRIFPFNFTKSNGEIGGFTISPRYFLDDNTIESEWTMFYLVTWICGNLPVCIVQIKHSDGRKTPRYRLNAYREIENRLEYVYNDDFRLNKHVDTIYGISCMGPLFTFLELDVETGRVYHPRLVNEPTEDEMWRPPANLWKYDVTTLAGAAKIGRLARHIRRMVDHLPGVAPNPEIEFYTSLVDHLPGMAPSPEIEFYNPLVNEVSSEDED